MHKGALIGSEISMSTHTVLPSLQLMVYTHKNMADILVSALAQTVIEKLSSVPMREIGLAWGLTDELNNLTTIFGTIQLVLKDAELKQRKSEAIQDWLSRLKNAAMDAENILDEIATESLRRRLDSEKGTQHKLKSYLSARNPLFFHSKMAHKVKNVMEKLDAIAKEGLPFKFNEGVVENRFGVTLESRVTGSFVNELDTCGRKDEKEMIIGELLDIRREQDDLSVYAIWGMGGIGKTTLTQMVYNDERTKNHFELSIWVCVSDDFTIQRLVKEIIESIEKCGCNVIALDPLQHLLQEKLRGRKFLLVLDDVWNENHRLWDGLKEVLRCGSKGSMLMVTTRIKKVADMMATISPNNIACLSENYSWSLFKRRAFTAGEEEDENLVAIGKGIVNKCGGLPLAINALGSMMRFKSDEREWLAIQESEIWNLSDDDILPALRLSYDNLMPQMRQCFAYCCIFPKDCWMEENQLIQLWMGNGFISPEGEADLLLTGHLIFKELVWRSFFQDVVVNNRGNRMCKIHDLMHDLALSVMRDEAYIMEHDKVPKIPKMLHHLCFDMKFSSVAPENKINLSIDDSLQSFILHRGKYRRFREGFFSFLSQQQYMRVLDINIDATNQKLPSLVCTLKHLRYLSMSCYKLKRLPESLTCLLNLQTLKLSNSDELLELPNGLKFMNNLWFLELEKCDSLLCTPPGLRHLTSLRSLSIFIVGEDESQRIDQLKELNLGGKLSIRCLENVRSLDIRNSNVTLVGSIASLASLEHLFLSDFTDLDVLPIGLLQNHTSLKELWIKALPIRTLSNMLDNLSALKFFDLCNCCNLEFLPDGLQCLNSLESLKIESCDSIRSLPAAALESLPSLRRLLLINCKKLKPLSGALQSGTVLQRLMIDRCPELKHLPDCIQQLSALTRLTIMDCEGLYCLPNWFGNLESLSTMDIHNCKNLKSLPDGFQNLRSLRELSIKGCPDLEKRCKKPKGLDWPKILHIPIIEINNETIQYLYQ